MSETGAGLSRVLDEVVRRPVGVAHPDRIILFGSAARGETGPDSDIDLLVIKQGVAHRGQLAGQIHRALVGVAVAVDVVVATPEDVEYLRDKVGSIMGPALREGREIYAESREVIRSPAAASTSTSLVCSYDQKASTLSGR